MIRFDFADGRPVVLVDVRGRCAVYLDTDSLIELAKRDPARREKLVSAIRRRGSLLFSGANILEIAALQGSSATAVREFLDSIGACWIPLKLSPWEVVQEERTSPERAHIAMDLVEAFFMQRSSELSPEGSTLLSLDADHFFRLSAIADWIQQHGSNAAYSESLDGIFRESLEQTRAVYEQEGPLPPVRYDGRHPAQFAMTGLLRTLVAEWKSHRLKPHDAMDFCHAVVGCSSANFATLDKQWKRRVTELPKPNGLAKVFYRPEVGCLVDEVDRMVMALEATEPCDGPG